MAARCKVVKALEAASDSVQKRDPVCGDLEVQGYYNGSDQDLHLRCDAMLIDKSA
jgi:hypothetical protein